tara:strand:+ start:1310 stop:2470 length:1161 start_codon:yes stop_codon:yes gene_type:complete
MEKSKLNIKYFGSDISNSEILNKINIIKNEIDSLTFYLIIAGTNTSQIKGISAAGIDSCSRKITPLADAEFCLFGTIKDYKYKLPLLKAGVTPALISNVCKVLLRANLIVIPIGVHKRPYFQHKLVEKTYGNPSNCLSTGKTMKKSRVSNLYKRGLSIGLMKNKPIVISESVPGGTTTAQAIMEAFGLDVAGLVGSSLIRPPRKLKAKIIKAGLLNAKLGNNFTSIDVISALGDPFQAFSMGLLIGARKSNNTVILAGGSQMVAILLLALEFISMGDKQLFSERVFVITTGWLACDESLRKLLKIVADKHKVKLYGFASGLNFNSSMIKELRDYEKGYVKEGVGAGGFSLLAYLKGFKYERIVSECELAIKRMREVGQISLYKEYQ